MTLIISGFDHFDDEPDCLTAIIKPLVERIAFLCAGTIGTEDLGEIQIDDQLYGGRRCEDNEAYVLLSLTDKGGSHVLPYLYALLLASGSEGEWMETDGEFAESRSSRTPIRFSVQKHACSHGEQVFSLRYLVAECRNPDFDPEAARKQVALLVEHLSNAANIHALPKANIQELF